MRGKGQPLIYTRHMAVGSYSPCTKSRFFYLNQHVWLPYARVICLIPVIQSSLFNIYVFIIEKARSPFFLAGGAEKKTPSGFNLETPRRCSPLFFRGRRYRLGAAFAGGDCGSRVDLVTPSAYAEIKLIWASRLADKGGCSSWRAGKTERKFWVILILVN